MKTILLFFCFSTAIIGCTRHEVAIQPVEIKPIHITIDVNVKVDRELDDFFGEIDQLQQEKSKKEKAQ